MPEPSPAPAHGDSAHGGSAHLLWLNPPVAAGDYAPAIWVPLTRLLAAHRRLLTMAQRLPERVWAAPSEIAGWRRRDVLAHLASQGAQHHRPLVAVLAGAPLTDWRPDPHDASIDTAAWNRRAVAARREWAIARLAGELESNLAESLRLWAADRGRAAAAAVRPRPPPAGGHRDARDPSRRARRPDRQRPADAALSAATAAVRRWRRGAAARPSRRRPGPRRPPPRYRPWPRRPG